MQILVSALDGKRIPIETSPKETINELLNKIALRLEISSEEISLIYQSVTLDLEALVEDCEIVQGAILHVKVDLLGGGKKRKKKNYTTPKKIKHKKKKVKLPILKLFSVDENGKMSYKRQSCSSCGPSTFLAQHYDRHSCGKCGLRIPISSEN